MRLNVARLVAVAVLPSFLSLGQVYALDLNVDDQDSIKSAASEVTYNMMTFYKGNGTDNPGFIERSWWTGAALFLACLNYRHVTGDTTYDEEVGIGMQHQGGADSNYNPSWAQGVGNDDQMFWGLAAITAAEQKFPNRPTGDSWTTLAIGVFNDQTEQESGWDSTGCGGGVRWQKQPFQSGYTMKNSVSNGGLMMVAARLAHYLEDDKYAKWAEKIWDWATDVKMVNNQTWAIADSVSPAGPGGKGCTPPDLTLWTYNYGVFMSGCAYMYAHTNDAKWRERTESIVDAIFATFFHPQKSGDAITENCEWAHNCYNSANNPLFKGLTLSWLADVATIMPDLKGKILPKLQTSAEGAAKSCSGDGKDLCGNRWWGGNDGQNKMESQISGSQAMSSAMLKFSYDKSVTVSTGGNGSSDPNAGKEQSGSNLPDLPPISTADKAGAGILTAIFISCTIAMTVFLVMDPDAAPVQVVSV